MTDHFTHPYTATVLVTVDAFKASLTANGGGMSGSTTMEAACDNVAAGLAANVDAGEYQDKLRAPGFYSAAKAAQAAASSADANATTSDAAEAAVDG